MSNDHVFYKDRVAGLRAALALARLVVEKRNTVPVLGTVLLSERDGALHVQATNLDCWIDVSLPVEVAATASFCLPAPLLADVLGNQPAERLLTITADAAGGHVQLSAGRSRVTLMTVPADQFPVPSGDLADVEGEHFVWSLKASRLKAICTSLLEFSSREEVRYYLNGAHLTDVRIEATDGRVLRRLPLVTETDGTVSGSCDIIISNATLKHMLKICAAVAESEQVSVIVAGQSVMRLVAGIDGMGIEYRARLVDGSFPDTGRVVPLSAVTGLCIDPVLLVESLERVSALLDAKERSVGLRLDPRAPQLALLALSPDGNAALETVDVSAPARLANTQFNPQLLASALGSFSAAVRLHLETDGGAPCLITPVEGDETNDLAVVMPMRGAPDWDYWLARFARSELEGDDQ